MIEKASVAAAIVPMTRRMKSSFIQASHESLPRGRTRTLRPSGTQQWKQLCWPNLGSDPAKKRGSATDVVLGPRLSCRPRVTYLGPRAEEHRSATERKCCRGRCALRCVSKHEGATQSLVLMFRDARTFVRVCGSARAARS